MAWDNAGGEQRSWEAYNRQVRDTILIAVRGFPWKENDLDAVLSLENRRYSIGRCLGEGGVENLYMLAVDCGNVSAIQEIERYQERVPLIADHVDHGHQRGNRRQRDRLAVGSHFRFGDRTLKVNSFRKDWKANCTYGDKIGGSKRFVIGPDEIKRDRKKRKAAARD